MNELDAFDVKPIDWEHLRPGDLVVLRERTQLRDVTGVRFVRSEKAMPALVVAVRDRPVSGVPTAYLRSTYLLGTGGKIVIRIERITGKSLY